jgi:hypothetical protein
MTRREAGAGLLSTAAAAMMPPVSALAVQPVVLPSPRSQGGKPLIEALRLRRSIREYSEQPLPPQVLSDLLWAAFGINRPSGDRTAPYWRHIMVIDVYAAMADGVWLYDPKQHKLLPHLNTDIRAKTGLQDFVARAPLNLVYVAHGERMQDIAAEERRLYASVDAGFIGTSTFSVRPKASRLCSAARWTIASSTKPCSSARDSSSRLRRRSAILAGQPCSLNLLLQRSPSANVCISWQKSPHQSRIARSSANAWSPCRWPGEVSLTRACSKPCS